MDGGLEELREAYLSREKRERQDMEAGLAEANRRLRELEAQNKALQRQNDALQARLEEAVTSARGLVQLLQTHLDAAADRARP